MKPLHGKVALVAGATRGCGRGIAAMLGEAGATVYCTGRSTRAHLSDYGRSETIEETAELVDQYGGVGIPVHVDHTQEEEVKALFARIEREQGRLDVLVNDIWGGDPLTDWSKPFWTHSLADGLRMQELAVRTHMITSRYGAPLMVRQGRGLIAEITDGIDNNCRGNLYYSLAKVSAIHLAQCMAYDFDQHHTGVSAVAISPGFLRSERMLDRLGVTEENWREGAQQEPDFIKSETPYYTGRAVAALAADPSVYTKNGQVLHTGLLAAEYGFTDIDGRFVPRFLPSDWDESSD